MMCIDVPQAANWRPFFKIMMDQTKDFFYTDGSQFDRWVRNKFNLLPTGILSDTEKNW